MQLVDLDNKISKTELAEVAQNLFGDMVKAVVDLNKQVMVIDAELHADQETWLLEHGSNQENLWGINLYPELEMPDFLEFDSMINLRPSSGNKSRGVDDPKVQQEIITLVNQLVTS